MEGFDRWDLVVWIVAAYIAIMALVRMMLYSLKSVRRSQGQRLPEVDATSAKRTSRRDAA